jgi:esterase
MKLHYNSYGSRTSPALIVLHGLLGSSDNWHSFGKAFGETFYTITLDARNHGRSPHSDDFNYQVMAEDVVEFMTQHNLTSASLLGHSMGGKTAALAALLHPELIDKLVIVDIAPRSYDPRHDVILDQLMSIDLNMFESRKDIEALLAVKIPEHKIRQFLMKNLERMESGDFCWKMNLKVIWENYSNICEALPGGRHFNGPALFIRGENSDYIKMDDLPLINKHFPQAGLITIKNAGHWVQADASQEFVEKVAEFLSF